MFCQVVLAVNTVQNAFHEACFEYQMISYSYGEEMHAKGMHLAIKFRSAIEGKYSSYPPQDTKVDPPPTPTAFQITCIFLPELGCALQSLGTGVRCVLVSERESGVCRLSCVHFPGLLQV